MCICEGKRERAIEHAWERERAHVSINMCLSLFQRTLFGPAPKHHPSPFLFLASSPFTPLPYPPFYCPPSLSLSYSISLKARYGVLLRMAARYCSIVAGWRTLSALVISSHEGSLITAAQRAFLHPHRPFSYPRCRPNIPASKIHTSQTP